MSLESRIQSLPQVLQDAIAEYNVDHRSKMKRVVQELMKREKTPECVSCGNWVDPLNKYVYYIAGNQVVCCSNWCKSNIKYKISSHTI